MTRFLKRYWLLIAVILACIAVQILYDLVLQNKLPRGPRLQAAAFLGALKFYVEVFQSGASAFTGQRYSMLLSHGFVHVGWLHLMVNMAMLACLGGLALPRLGAWRFAALYFGTMAAAAAVYGLMAAPEMRLVGASGGIHGIAGALLVLLAREGRPSSPPFWRAGLLALILLALNGWFYWLTGGHFAWGLHLAGLAFGAVAALLLPPKMQNAAPKDGVS